MRRNVSAIATRIEDYYSVVITKSLQNPKLFYTDRPYGAEAEFIADIHGDEIVFPDPLPGKRPYFVVRSDDHAPITVAARRVDVPGVDNFRDQGGHLAADGKEVKWGRFFRGAAFSDLDRESQTALDSLGIRTILDYRGSDEQERHPDYVPSGAKLLEIGAIRNMDGMKNAEIKSLGAMIGSAVTEELMEEGYQGFASIYRELPFHNPAYQAMFDALDKEETTPIYQHCTMGKDRTGVGCAMLLLALGVDRETVMGEYLLSAAYRSGPNKRFFAEFAKQYDNVWVNRLYQRTMDVEEGLLKSTLDAIDEQYPSYEAFLKEEYQVGGDRLEHWRQLHLV